MRHIKPLTASVPRGGPSLLNAALVQLAEWLSTAILAFSREESCVFSVGAKNEILAHQANSLPNLFTQPIGRLQKTSVDCTLIGPTFIHFATSASRCLVFETASSGATTVSARNLKSEKNGESLRSTKYYASISTFLYYNLC